MLAYDNLWPVGPLFVGALFGRIMLNMLNPPLPVAALRGPYL